MRASSSARRARLKLSARANRGVGFDLTGFSAYIVRMKNETSPMPPGNGFRLFDEVASPAIPEYAALLQVPDAEQADRWSWDWAGPEEELQPTISESGRPRTVKEDLCTA